MHTWNYALLLSVPVLSTLRTIKINVMGTIGQAKSWMRSQKWVYTNSKMASDSQNTAHILVINNDEYVKVAKTCVESFLHFNPLCKVVLHCDSATLTKSQQLLRKSRKRRDIEFRLINHSSEHLWQITKLNLILSMNGTKDIFMDADLRWNGPLPQIEYFTYFVKEFEMKDKSPFREILSNGFHEDFPDTFMKNVSFISFSKQLLPDEALVLAKNYCEKYIESVNGPLVGKLDKISKMRMVEQVVLSLLIPKFLDTVGYLKDSDQIMDGRFVESSYFGATGARFS